MTVAEASKLIGISASLVYELCRLGSIRHSRHGRPGRRGCIRISEDAIGEYLANAERTPALDEREPLKHIRVR
jgi:excisionase family DNA binding protein